MRATHALRVARRLTNAAPHSAVLAFVATSLLSPAQSCGEEEGDEDSKQNVEAHLGMLASVPEVRAQAARVPGVTVSIRMEAPGRALHLYATIRNDSSRRYVLEWPVLCRRGRKVYLSGTTAIVTRSRATVSDRRTDGFNWEDWDPSDREPELTWVLLEPATQLVEEVVMTDPAMECTDEEDARAYWGRPPSGIQPFTSVLVGYELVEFLEPEYISWLTPDGNLGRRRAPARTLIVAEAAVPPVVRLARKRNQGGEVHRTWSISRPAPYR